MSGKRKVGLPDGFKAKRGLKAQFQRPKKRLTRRDFERLINGTWESHHGDRVRINGPFITLVQPGLKTIIIAAGKEHKRVQKPSWLEIAKELLIGDHGHED
jgi:hypothetical protein